MFFITFESGKEKKFCSLKSQVQTWKRKLSFPSLSPFIFSRVEVQDVKISRSFKGQMVKRSIFLSPPPFLSNGSYTKKRQWRLQMTPCWVVLQMRMRVFRCYCVEQDLQLASTKKKNTFVSPTHQNLSDLIKGPVLSASLKAMYDGTERDFVPPDLPPPPPKSNQKSSFARPFYAWAVRCQYIPFSKLI